MKQPSFPPRLSESSNDTRLVEALDIVKGTAPSEARVRGALARFEAGRGAAASNGAVSASSRGSMGVLKVGAVAALVIAIAGGWTVVRSSTEPAPPANVPAPADTSANAPVLDEPAAAPLEAPSIRVDDLPAATPPAPKPAARAATSLSFDDELALVESARTALSKGDASGCLARLDDYDRRVQKGTFEREVTVMRVEALIARGDTARARSLGEAFLEQSPDSPYANRIRSLLARIRPTSTP